jgi:hypothetical protein
MHFRARRAFGSALSSLLTSRPWQLRDMILERANSLDFNLDCVTLRQRKVIPWNNPCPGHQKHTLGKAVVAEEKLG